MKYGVYAFISVFALVGLGIMAFGISGVLDGSNSTSWPMVRGEVIKSEYVITKATQNSFRTEAQLRYRYNAVGNELESDRIGFNYSGSGSPGENRQLTNEYPVGSEVDVYYDPEDPKEALLRPGVAWEAWLFIAFGAVFTAAPVGMLFVARHVFNRIGSSLSNEDLVSLRGTGRNTNLWFPIVSVFFGIFLTVGLVVLGFGISARRVESGSVDWPSTQGTVVCSGVRHETSQGENGTEDSYYPRVVYDFELDGVVYTAEGITLSDAGSGKRRNAATAIKPYREGKPVEVFYDANDPYTATLKTGHSTGTFIAVLIGSIFAVVGGVGVAIAFIAKARQNLQLNEGPEETPAGAFHDPFAETEAEDPYDAPWSEHEDHND